MRSKLFFVAQWRTVVVVLFAVVGAALMCTSCSKDDVTVRPCECSEGEAYVTDSAFYSSPAMKAYNFVYPSVDPYGNPIMLSGTITMPANMPRHAKGLLLYNHFTIYRADQCPSRGELSMQHQVANYDLITISADYYGFGVTEQYNQAYCLSGYNARTSIDALLAAKKLLACMGYTWDDRLFNAGYSQGGQTAMAVVRLVAEQYPDIDITYTFAGAGPYDIPETYHQFVNATIAGMPSTVISVMLSYNEFFELSVPYDRMFIEPALSHIDDWILSKRYTRQEIDSLVGSLNVADFATAELLDTTSELSARFVQAFDSDNLCHGWTPRGTERIMLFHSTHDITVPVATTEHMYQFLTTHGVQDVDLQIRDIEATATVPAHEYAALTFGILAMMKLNEMINGGN